MFRRVGPRGAILMLASSLGAQEIEAPALYASLAPSVFRINGRYGRGSGFLVDARGLIVTNAHVVSGDTLVTVQLDDSTRVKGVVVGADPFVDLAVVRVHPDAAVGRTAVELTSAPPTVGAAIAALGYPLFRGPVLTTGRVSFVSGSTIMLDLNLNPGNSGGPVLDPSGHAIGVATFRLSSDGGQGMAGAVGSATVVSLLESVRARPLPEPSAQRQPVLPLRPFPWQPLEEAAAADEWPDELYDISREAAGADNNFTLQFFTPPFQHRRRVRSEEDGIPADDLSRYDLELGEYPPAVILRVTPKVGQSVGGIVANIFGAVASGLSPYRPYVPVYSPELKGDIRDVKLFATYCNKATGACAGSEIEAILEAYGSLAVNGRVGDAAYVQIEFEVFAPQEDGSFPRFFVQVADGRKNGEVSSWSVPQETAEQLWNDFAPYRALLDMERP